ncbi:MAG TPA: hypothetical protein VIF60_06365 [Burkholderiaceae bacterium]
MSGLHIRGPLRISVGGLLFRLGAVWPELIVLPLLGAALWKMIDVAMRYPLLALLPEIDAVALQSLLLGALLYIGAHLLRAARLSLLIGVGKVPFNAILGCNSAISLLTFALPLKLGELARALEFYRLTRCDPRAIFAIWIERCFDAVIVLCLIELASSAVIDSSFAQLTRRGLMVLLGLSFFVALFGRSALSALLRLLSSSHSQRSLKLMRLVRRMEALACHIPPLTRPNLALLFIVSCAIWILEIAAVLVVTAGTMVFQHHAIDAFVEIISTAAIGIGNSGALAVLLYRMLISCSLLLLTLLFVRPYLRARKAARSSYRRTSNYTFHVREQVATTQRNARVR